MKECHCLPDKTNVDWHNDKDNYNKVNCDKFNYNFCEEKYKSTDCINEYYSFRTMYDANFNEHINILGYSSILLLKQNIDKLT